MTPLPILTHGELAALQRYLFRVHGMRWPTPGLERRAIAAFCDARGLWSVIDDVVFGRLADGRGERSAVVGAAHTYEMMSAPGALRGAAGGSILADRPCPRRVFVAYSRRDAGLLCEFDTHLASLRRQGLIVTWTDREIIAGQRWDTVIQERHAQADLYLFLVSADFLATDYCYEIEVTRALERRSRGEAAAVSIILRPCVWESTPLGEIQALPGKGRPITQWEDRDVAWTAVVRGLREVLAGLCPAPGHPAS